MRVFVAGATGVLGRRAVPALAAAGHEVTALVRSPAKAALARSLGATPVEVSLFDPDALRAAVAGHDAVCNLATHIPPLAKAAQAGSWQENSRIRSEGSRNLVDAALAAGAACYVQESIAFLYGEHGDESIDACTAPIVESAPTGPVRAAEAEAARFAAAGGRGVVLRFGGFVAPDSDQTLTILRAARRGFAVEPGRPEAWFPSIAVDDAATAVVAALAAPSGTYDVVNDEPLRRRDRGRCWPPPWGAGGSMCCRARSGSSVRWPTRSASRIGAFGRRRAGRPASRAFARVGRPRRARRHRARAPGEGAAAALAARVREPRRRDPGCVHAPILL